MCRRASAARRAPCSTSRFAKLAFDEGYRRWAANNPRSQLFKSFGFHQHFSPPYCFIADDCRSFWAVKVCYVCNDLLLLIVQVGQTSLNSPAFASHPYKIQAAHILHVASSHIKLKHMISNISGIGDIKPVATNA